MNLFVSGHEWLAFTPSEVRSLAAFPRLNGPACLVWAPDRAVSGVAALEGNARHAAVLIERRLRAEGNIEGDVKVFIHHVSTVGQGYQALYSAVPLEEWQRLLAWSSALPHHCLLLPGVALVWDTLKKNGTAAVFRHGTHLVFLGFLEGRILHANTIAFSGSGSDEDAMFAAQALGERARDELANAGLEAQPAPVAVSWYSVQRSGGAGSALTDAFASASGLRVVPQGEEAVTDAAGARLLSSIPFLARRADVRLALNAPADKWCFQADRYLPACVALCVLVSLAAFATGAGWLWQSRVALQQIETLAGREAAAAKRLEVLGQSVQMPSSISDQLAFLDAMQKLQAGHDVAGLLASVKAASSTEVRVLGVRIEDAPADKKGGRTGPAFLVDGILSDASPDQGSALLSFFVRSMRRDGYEIEAVDARGPATGATASSRMFSYRVQPRKTEEARR